MKIAEVGFSERGSHIITWTRDKDNNLVKEIHAFKHYYYIQDDNGEHVTLFGDKCRKQYVPKFWETKAQIKTLSKPTYEDDLPYIKRFQIDHFDKLKSEGTPRVCFYDIETTGFSSEHMEIISIVAYDSYTEEYTSFCWYPGEIDKCHTEKQMLEEFVKYVQLHDPDILTGWNSDRFDYPFIYDRMEILGLNPGRLGRTGRKTEPYYSGDRLVYKIPGRINLDYMKVYKKMNIAEMDSYALDYVAEKELGVGKIDIQALPGELWETGRDDELLLYNKRDVEIMVQLDKKLAFIEFLDEISHLASCSIEDTLFNSRVVDSYILKYTSDKGIVLPSRSFSKQRRGYTGAKVLDPKVGIHDNVGIFDLASLYPSIIISFNLSPETMQREDRVRETSGLVPILLEDLFTLRRNFRDQGLDIQQKVVKTIMNSIYGVMALPSFRLYTQSMAEAITRHGREIIEHTKMVVEDEGYDVIYGDTDSVFVSGIRSHADARALESRINSQYETYARSNNADTHRLQIEFEAFAPRALMVKKKRYAMRLDDGTNKIAGFQLKRSDTQALARTLQETVINYILDGAKAKDVIVWYQDQKQGALNGRYDIELGIPRKFSKKLDQYADNYAVRGAIYANEHLNKNFGAGDKVVAYHVKSTEVGREPTDAIALEYKEEIPPEYIIDRKKHWTRVEKALLPLLNDANLLVKEKQTTLGDLM